LQTIHRAGWLLAATLVAVMTAPTASQPASAGRPNVLLVLLDDSGYGQTGTFGGLIPTPTLDALAASGLRFTRFHVAALCSPTRASLLTGRNNHAVGMGTITNWSTDSPGYNASIPASAAMVSEIVRRNGYATASIGKWHLIPDPETTPAGPFDHWPTHQGFDYFYGFIGGETDQWHPELVEGTKPTMMVPPEGRERDFTLTEDLADHARAWILQQKAIEPDRPVFMYFAPGATHAPLQAPAKWIEPFKGTFDMGWDVYRTLVIERQKKLGVIPADTVLTPRPPEIPAWDSLTSGQKKVAARLMEVFAGFMAQADHEVGRVIDAFRQTGQLDNTLVIYIAGDNGASLEGGLYGTDNLMEQINGLQSPADEVLRHLDDIGGPLSNPHYPVGWAWAGNTPFQWGKRFGSHLGGTRDPMVVSWPAHIRNAGGTRAQYAHVIDVFPTILQAAHIPQPRSVNGVEQLVVDGVSFFDTLTNASASEHHTRQYFEMHGNMAMYSGGWIAARRSGLLPWTTGTASVQPPWELYDLNHDYSESNDLARAHPETLERLKKEFDREAEKNKVLPIDSRFAGREHRNPPPPGGRAFYTFYPGATHLFDATAPATRNRTHTFSAYIDVPAGGADGVLVAEGGLSAGYALFVKAGRPTYTYNYFRREVTTIAARDRLPPGKSTIELHFAYDGGGEGKGATVTLIVNGVKAAEARLAHTAPRIYSYDETFDVGEDSSTAVGPYVAPFPFAGSIEKVEVRSGRTTRP
jgi:arylsulfatase